jgi:hypothetical protein
LQFATGVFARASKLAAALLLAVPSLFGATFIVPHDEQLAQHAPAIVIASALHSYTQRNERHSIETVTTLSIEEVIKGDLLGDNLDVIEPGGEFEREWVMIPGVPRFRDGDRYLLFLTRADGRWHVLDLELGKFNFKTDVLGREVVLRDEASLEYPRDTTHAAEHRHADRFVQFLRSMAKGGPARSDYYVSAEPLMADNIHNAPHGLHLVLNATFTATSYTFVFSGNLGGRWNVFPTAVNFYNVGTEPGAPGNGITAINAAIAAWNNDPNSNVNYAYAGSDSTHTAGISGSDGLNTIAFERDLSAYGAGPFTCTSNSYNGTLGLGGITNASGTHAGPNGETFYTAREGDVEMNKGIANCTLLFNNGDFNTAVAHEVGHTLGFRHSDQTRADNPSIACSTDATLECSSTAVMKSFIPNGLNAALQAWDQHAVAALYPGTSNPPPNPPPAPTGVNARATSTTQVLITWNASANATAYDVYRKSAGVAYARIATVAALSYTDNTVTANKSYLYFVRATNSGGASPDSSVDLATTVIFTNDPLTKGVVIRAVHLAELRTAVNAVRTLAALSANTFTDSAVTGVVIKATHIIELRNALDAARAAFGFSTGGYTDPTLTHVAVKAVHLQEIRDRVK